MTTVLLLSHKIHQYAVLSLYFILPIPYSSNYHPIHPASNFHCILPIPCSSNHHLIHPDSLFLPNSPCIILTIHYLRGFNHMYRMETTQTTPPKPKKNTKKASSAKKISGTEVPATEGKKRVVIERLSPQVVGGFPVKRTVGEKVEVTADVFSDGHDIVKAAILYRASQAKEEESVPMRLINNDRWIGAFTPDQPGFYEYTVMGYIDHFATWQYGLRKKFDAQQDVSVELLSGVEMLKEATKSADASDKKQLKAWAKQLKEAKAERRPDDTIPASVELSLSEEVTEVMDRCYDKSNATRYPDFITIEVERKKALFSTWYEFFPRSAAREPGKHGTFKDAARLLPRVADMGFDVVYFPPIHPIGKKNRKGLNNAVTAQPGDPGSCWAIGSNEGGHKAIHPELGTMKDFTDLVEKAKKLDMEIALDIAYQCAPDHPYVKEHPEWFKWRPDGTVQYAENPPKKYQDILPINFESEDWENLWKELKSVIDFWIDKGISIFRIDNPHTKSFPFWQWCIKAVRTEHPEVLFLAEAFTRPRVMERLAKIGFNQSYTYFTWRTTPYEMREYMEELVDSPMRDYFRPNFWPNTPDILTPELVYGGEPAHIMRLLLAATLSSNYGLYGPVYEFCVNQPYPGKEEYIDSEKYEIKHWDWNADTRIKEIITRINRIRKENPALQSTWNITFGDADNSMLLCYAKKDEATGNTMLMVVNMDPYNTQSGYVRVPLEEMGLDFDRPYTVHDLLSYSQYSWYGEWNYVSLNPYLMPAHVFQVSQ